MASRLETNAPPGGIYISQMTRDLISDQVPCEPQVIETLKGVGEVKIWSVLEIKPKRLPYRDLWIELKHKLW